jgi:hypothetical protein
MHKSLKKKFKFTYNRIGYIGKWDRDIKKEIDEIIALLLI